LISNAPEPVKTAAAMADAITAPLIVINQDVVDEQHGEWTWRDTVNTGAIIAGAVAFPFLGPEATFILWGFAGNAGAFGW
jgi:hypothetical protein